MPQRTADFALGLLLVVLSALWCVGVVATVPDLQDELRPGPRAFPLGLGVLLGILGAIVALQSLLARPEAAAAEPDEAPPARHAELWAFAAVAGNLLVYASLLYYTGFVIATAATMAATVGLVLGDRRPRMVLGFPLAFTAGVYLLLGKVLGVYLPVGSIVNLAI